MQTTLRRSQDTRPAPPGLSPRDVYDFAKPRADALRLAIGDRAVQRKPVSL